MTDIQGLPSIQVYGLPCIKLSDFDAHRKDWKLDERHLIICPDEVWPTLERMITAMKHD